MRFDFSFLPSVSRTRVSAMPTATTNANSSSNNSNTNGNMMRKPSYSSPRHGNGSNNSPSSSPSRMRKTSSASAASPPRSAEAASDPPASLCAYFCVKPSASEALVNEEELEAALQHAGMAYLASKLTKKEYNMSWILDICRATRTTVTCFLSQ